MGIIQNYSNPELGKEFKDPATGNLKLKSLKFPGGDKFTSQPFIQTPIPDDNKIVTKPATSLAAYVDGVVHGSLISVQRSARDVERLTKYMATPSGVQFALKQNLLSRVAVGTETSGFFNEGIYTPLSTLAQAGVGVLGIHLNKQGLLAGIGQTKYIKQVSGTNSGSSSENRLVALSNRAIGKKISGFKLNPSIDTILRYGGGPGSILGIGYTKIRYATGNDGKNPLKLMGSNNLNPKTYLIPGKKDKSSIDDEAFKQSLRDKFIPILGASDKYNSYISKLGYTPISSILSKSKSNLDWVIDGKSTYSVYDPDTLDTIDGLSNYLIPGKKGNGLSISSNEPERRLLAESSYHSPINDRLIEAKREIVDHLERPYILDSFDVSPKIVGHTEYSSAVTLNVGPASKQANADLKHGLHQEGKDYLANLDKNMGYYNDNGTIKYIKHRHSRNIGPDFRKTSRDVRGFGDGNPVAQATYYDKVTQQTEWYGGKSNPSAVLTVDEIYYASGTKRESTDFGIKNDLITFRIKILDPKAPDNKEILTFRAYIDNLSDNYNPEWNAQTYMGRGEKFYKYNSFDRKISLGFTVVAEGEHHLKKKDQNGNNISPMYDKLNQLASSLAPTYTDQGYMAGNIHQLTIGNYINNQYGIITGMTYEIMDESPWDIESGKQLPMYIKVTGFQFTPIHDFRPEYKTPSSNLKSPKFINQA